MISLLTLTGDRPELFARCERYMQRQTIGWHQWVVVDDGHEPTETTGNQERIRRRPGDNPVESFKNNLQAGLRACTEEFIFIIEDDDWYHPDHINRLLSMLADYELVGEAFAKYYHVGQRQYRQIGNHAHASFCQSAFRRSLIPKILARLDTAFIDMRIWREPTIKRYLFRTSETCVGLKGQVGRPGIGIGHRPRGPQWKGDPDGTVLREWIGEADAAEVLQCTATVAR